MNSDKTVPGDLARQLATIGLRYLPDHLEDFVARATKASWTAVQIVEEIARVEAQEKACRSLQSRIRQAQIGRVKPMADFDWGWPQKVNRTLVEDLFKLDFVRDFRNVILVGTQGLTEARAPQRAPRSSPAPAPDPPGRAPESTARPRVRG